MAQRTTASGLVYGPASSPFAWRESVEEGFGLADERRGMHGMAGDLYAIAMHMGHRRTIDQNMCLDYDPTPVTGVVASKVDRVRLTIRVLVALGYLHVVREPRRGRGGQGRYQLTTPTDSDGGVRPDLAAGWKVLDEIGVNPSGSKRDTSKATEARKEAAAKRRETEQKPVDNFPVDDTQNDRGDGHLNDRGDGHLNDRGDGQIRSDSSYWGSGTTGDTDLYDATTDAAVDDPRSETSRIGRQLVREALAEVHALKRALDGSA